MPIIGLKYDPSTNEGQLNFHQSLSRLKWMVGAFGSGKSATGCVEGLILSTEFGGNRGLIARKKVTDLKMTTMKTFFNHCPSELIRSWNKVDRELIIKSRDGIDSEIFFGPLDDIDRYKSLELGWFFIDEANECPKDIFLTLIGRLRVHRTYPDGRVLKQYGMLASNPTTTRHWLYDTFIAHPTPDMEVFRSKTKDNKAHLPPDYIDHLVRNMPRDWVKRYVEGEFGLVQEGEPVFPDFSIERHAKKLQPIKNREIMRGWDFGKRGQFCVWCQFDDMGRFRILKSILKEIDMDDFAPLVIKTSNQTFYGHAFKDYCDPSGANDRDAARSYVQILNGHGIWPRYRFSKPSDRHPEFRRLMRTRIQGEEAFLIDPAENEYLIEGLLGGYCHQKGSDVFEEKIEKTNYFKHGVDGIGYVLVNTSLAETPQSRAIESVQIARPRWGHSKVLRGHFGKSV